MHYFKASSMTLELIDSLEYFPGNNWSCVTLSFSAISLYSIIVFCEMRPYGVISALSISKANSRGRGSDQP